ncbi:hypothetical protein AURDEDRAFT_176378 [Auricularia subglabra TFB-10046 SS5]|uniref:ATPase AAA-type core domain-containing protein n=1 Tax=Auricularia subglabra (strain TFB-10046 / SS5) TaxID=717982 RepID=J0WRL2_AURST|nr:hypothetical protein AURDEDRAFT_176378 [Auricularia subglabra TFB-10046 SS5]
MQTVFLLFIGLVTTTDLRPGEAIGLSEDSVELVHDAFKLANEKMPTIILIDNSSTSVMPSAPSASTQRRAAAAKSSTMLKLLSQCNGLGDVCREVIAATNHIDILDRALLQSGCLDFKILLLPNNRVRTRILQIHSRKMTVGSEADFDELVHIAEEFNAT